MCPAVILFPVILSPLVNTDVLLITSATPAALTGMTFQILLRRNAMIYLLSEPFDAI